MLSIIELDNDLYNFPSVTVKEQMYHFYLNLILATRNVDDFCQSLKWDIVFLNREKYNNKDMDIDTNW